MVLQGRPRGRDWDGGTDAGHERELGSPGLAGPELAGTVDSESDAVAMLKRRPVDVVLLDLHLHSGTGFGVLRVINSGEVGKVLAIILTNYDLGEYRRAAAALGARYFLDKLRDFDRLPGLLQQIRADIDEAPERSLQVGCA